MKWVGGFAVFFFLSVAFISSAFSASALGPKGRGGRTQTVAEPAAIVLLGAGLVSLGFYAVRKRGKK